MYTIYLITNLVNGKVYVGQTNQPLHRRWGLHKSRARRNEGYTAHLYNAMRKHGIEYFIVEPLTQCETEEESNKLETLWIITLGTTNRSVGYNMTFGGERPTPTPEKIEKQRQKMIGRKATPEQKARQSVRLKLAYAAGTYKGATGYKFTAEQKAAHSARITGKGHPQYFHHICSEELLFLWNNLVGPANIAKHFNISKSTVERRVKSLGLPYHDYSAAGGRSGKFSAVYKHIDMSLVEELLKQGMSVRQISFRVGIDCKGVAKRIDDAGLTRNRR